MAEPYCLCDHLPIWGSFWQDREEPCITLGLPRNKQCWRCRLSRRQRAELLGTFIFKPENSYAKLRVFAELPYWSTLDPKGKVWKLPTGGKIPTTPLVRRYDKYKFPPQKRKGRPHQPQQA